MLGAFGTLRGRYWTRNVLSAEFMHKYNHLRTECRHLFCKTCLFKWYQQQDSCPLCRRELDLKTVSHVHEYLGNQHMFEDYPTRAPATQVSGLYRVTQRRSAYGISFTPVKILLDAGISTRCVPKLSFSHTTCGPHERIAVYVDGAHEYQSMPQTAYEPVALLQRAFVHLSETPIPDMSDEEIYARQGCDHVVTPGDVFMIHNNMQVHATGLSRYGKCGIWILNGEEEINCFKDKTKQELSALARAADVDGASGGATGVLL